MAPSTSRSIQIFLLNLLDGTSENAVSTFSILRSVAIPSRVPMFPHLSLSSPIRGNGLESWIAKVLDCLAKSSLSISRP